MAAKTRATLIVAHEEKIRYIQNYTKLDKTIELTLVNNRDTKHKTWFLLKITINYSTATNA